MIEPTKFTHRTALFPIPTIVLERMLRTGMVIEIFKGLPDDAIITSIQKGINQDAYVISVRSKTFPKSRRYDILELMDNMSYTFHRGNKYGAVSVHYNWIQKFVIKLFKIKV